MFEIKYELNNVYSTRTELQRSKNLFKNLINSKIRS